MKKVLGIFVLSLSVLLSGCNQSQPTPTSSVEPSSEPSTQVTTSTEPASTSTPTSTTDISHNVKFYMHGSYLPFENYGIPITDEASGYTHRDKLQQAINDQAGFDVVSSISADSCTILTDNGQTDKDHFHLGVGTGKYSGYIEFTFSKQVTKVIVETSAYYKTYDGGASIDTDSKIIIADQEYTLPTDPSASSQPVQTITKEFSTSVSTIRFGNDAGKQRFYLDSIEVFY